MTSKREVLAASLIVALIDGKPTQKLREQIAVLDRDKAAEAHAQARNVTSVRWLHSKAFGSTVLHIIQRSIFRGLL